MVCGAFLILIASSLCFIDQHREQLQVGYKVFWNASMVAIHDRLVADDVRPTRELDRHPEYTIWALCLNM